MVCIFHSFSSLSNLKPYVAAEKLEAAMPVYNVILMKIIGVRWWTILLFIPDQLNYVPIIWVETLRSFGKRSTLDTF
jgi:signal peptidase I